MDTPEPGNVDIEGRVFLRWRVGLPIAAREIRPSHKDSDQEALLASWHRIYGVLLSRAMKSHTAYWGKITCLYNEINHIRRLSFAVGTFVVHATGRYVYQIVRIVSMYVGTLRRAFIVGRRLYKAVGYYAI